MLRNEYGTSVGHRASLLSQRYSHSEQLIWVPFRGHEFLSPLNKASWNHGGRWHLILGAPALVRYMNMFSATSWVSSHPPHLPLQNFVILYWPCMTNQRISSWPHGMTSARYAMNFPVSFLAVQTWPTNYNIYIIKATDINTVHNIFQKLNKYAMPKILAYRFWVGKAFSKLESLVAMSSTTAISLGRSHPSPLHLWTCKGVHEALVNDKVKSIGR